MRLASLATLAALAMSATAADPAPKLYELRIYTAAPGKFEAMNKRYREHLVRLFAKHGITNVAYFVPPDNKEGKLYYLLAHPDLPTREKNWKAMHEDTEYLEEKKVSHKDGNLTAKTEQYYLTETDFSPKVEGPSDKPRVFELRIYTTPPGRLPNLLARFRDHTVKLFEKHGMTNLWYWTVATGPKKENTLVYFLAHPSAEAKDAAFNAFRADPVWNSARDKSEQAAGGPLTVPQPEGVKSVLLVPTDYSPLK